MARLLFVVEDRFEIAEHGLVPVPGFQPIDDERFMVGDLIRLRKPDGTDTVVPIGGIELPNPNPNHLIVILLKGLTKADVPIGTEVWSIEHTE